MMSSAAEEYLTNSVDSDGARVEESWVGRRRKFFFFVGLLNVFEFYSSDILVTFIWIHDNMSRV